MGCSDAALLAAMDAAIHDGVDILSLSLGIAGAAILTDPVAIGGFHAIEHGITVVCSAGNSGPGSATVLNSSLWLTTVAASSIDRQFYASIVLGNSQVIKGVAIQFSGLNESPTYPLIDGVSAKINGSEDRSSRNCKSGLDGRKIKGRIVVCFNADQDYPFTDVMGIEDQGGVGVVVIDDDLLYEADTEYPNISFLRITVISNDGDAILSYIQSNRNSTATILKSEASLHYKPASVIASFSSRGPWDLTHNILKPDITAPGVNIIAAWSKLENYALTGQDSPDYVLVSGTSLSCPHIMHLAMKLQLQNYQDNKKLHLMILGQE